MPERIGFCFISLHHSSLKRLAKKMSLNLKGKMMMQIEVKVKNVYGVQRIYPICANALLFCQLTKTETITSQSLDIIKTLGYRVVVVQEQWQL